MSVKRILRWCGSTLAVIGLIFVGLQIHDHSLDIDISDFGLFKWSTVLLLTFIYAISNLMLALAWRDTLTASSAAVSKLWAIKTFGISQIAKYVPGNIFHLAGRQVIGVASGISGSSLLKSTAWEFGLLVLAGSLYVSLVLPLVGLDISIYICYFFFSILFTLAARFIYVQIGIAATRAFVWYTCFLALSGVVFICLLEIVSTSTGENTTSIITLVPGAYVLAWLIGLITPGAPAGIGVRELVLLTLLKGVIPELDLLVAVVLGRIVTAGGDMMFFFGSYVMPDTKAI